MKKQSLLLIVMLVFIAACSNDKIGKGDLVIKGGYFFGECYGTCQATIEIVGNNIIFIGKDNSKNNASKECSAKVSDKVISDLKASIDFKAFKKLPMSIGCPDCTDGGAQWVEISKGGESHKVVFNYNNPPSEIKELGTFFSQQLVNFRGCK